MSVWQKWKKRPQTVLLRKALFQVHLWTGIGLGLYILLMSVTGSAVVFRRELTRTLALEPRVAVGPAVRMDEDALKRIAKQTHPDYEVTRVSLRKNPDQAAEIWLERPGKKLQRLFNPYTGADLGDSLRWGFRFVLWLVDLHDNLLAGTTGRLWNAAGGIFTVFLGLTGAVIWWPGTEAWRRSLSFRWKGNPKGVNWPLHSALGFWSFLFFFLWALSGIYLSIPNVFNSAVDYLEPLTVGSRNLRFGDQVLFWLAQLHFGRFAGIGTKMIWTAVGLTPAVLFITGSLMWWNRVVNPWRIKKQVMAARLKTVSPVQSENSVQAQD
ncbi:MAG TPA: PepSY-associated TM helix domain-containing protein [Candidatus Saccharimonadales bacterium]|jgi:uncharacterized iron-regulated membrane protein|nr:PepSY-associated TM helix domain-containing protein [Candidatus Saccharimonadales bacterium]